MWKPVVVIAIATLLGARMSDADPARDLTDQLDAATLHSATLEQLARQATPATRNEVVARLARRFAPPPSGRLLMRVIALRTPDNERDLRQVFLANLHAPDPAARAASLRGLETLRYPHLVDLAITELRDASDEVVAAACDLLREPAKQDPQLARLLGAVYAAHAGQKEFYLSNELLKAHGFDKRP